jgi:hypothetical protein
MDLTPSIIGAMYAVFLGLLLMGAAEVDHRNWFYLKRQKHKDMEDCGNEAS